MQIVTSIKQFDDLKNILVEKVFVRLKVHEETIFCIESCFWSEIQNHAFGVGHRTAQNHAFGCYEDKKEEKHLLLTYVEWLAQTKRNDVVDSSFPSTRGCGSHNKKNKGHGRGRRHGCERGGKGGRDNSSQTHDNSNP